MKLAFYVSGNGIRLRKLLQKSSKVIDDTVLVINDQAPNNELIKLASSHQIHYHEFSYQDLGLKTKARNTYLSSLLLELFIKHQIDYCFCFGNKILGGDLLKVYKNKIINFHPAILPAYPGEKSIDQAIEGNAYLLGNTAHFIDEGTDTGPVIMQSIIHQSRYTEPDSVLDLQLTMIEQIYQWIRANRLKVLGKQVIINKANYRHVIYYPDIESM